jgi:hypothetical protein
VTRFERADDALLRVHERFSHRTQEWFGLTNFFWARVLLIAYTFFPIWAGLTPNRAGSRPQHMAAITVFGTLLNALLVSRVLANISKAERHYEGGSSAAHPLSMNFNAAHGMRLALVALTTLWVLPSLRVFDIGTWTYWALVACWLAVSPVAYFLSVIPKPRGKSKAREFLESLVPAPEMVPVPVK